MATSPHQIPNAGKPAPTQPSLAPLPSEATRYTRPSQSPKQQIKADRKRARPKIRCFSELRGLLGTQSPTTFSQEV